MLKHRETKQRRIVLETVRSHTDHPTANQGTVYRNLNCLSEDGEILHIKVSGADRYDLRTDLHYHIICLKCGKVIDIPFNYLSDSDEKVANATGYTVFRHRAVFEGICPECKTENNI